MTYLINLQFCNRIPREERTDSGTVGQSKCLQHYRKYNNNYAYRHYAIVAEAIKNGKTKNGNSLILESVATEGSTD